MFGRSPAHGGGEGVEQSPAPTGKLLFVVWWCCFMFVALCGYFVVCVSLCIWLVVVISRDLAYRKVLFAWDLGLVSGADFGCNLHYF